MAISKSGKEQQGWAAGAFLYSGRPDPVWKISNSVARKLLEIWHSLPISDEKAGPQPGRLGYRGCFLRGSDNREWIAFNGVGSLREEKGVETRKDVARKFEKQLLSSAPKRLLPDDLLSGKWT
jgi:hypothetical protein